MGYIGLARFASAQLIVTGTVLSVLYLLMIWIEAVGQSIGDENAQGRPVAEGDRRPRPAPPRATRPAGDAAAENAGGDRRPAAGAAAMGLRLEGHQPVGGEPVLRLHHRRHAHFDRRDPGLADRLRARLSGGAAVPGLARPAGAGAGRHFRRHAPLDPHRRRLSRRRRGGACSRSPMRGWTCPTSRWSPARCRSVSASACRASSTISSPA